MKQDMAAVASRLRLSALLGVFDGRETPRAQGYLKMCRRVHMETQTVVLFTRDTGMHSSGWMKNPDYERCFHLSLSPAPSHLILPSHIKAKLDKKTIAAWVKVFFGDNQRYLWAESPKSDKGIALGVIHWRLFCNESWEPILPRGEVYSTEFTELGWRTASQVLEEDGTLVTSTVDPS
jgi:hypothetical protein